MDPELRRLWFSGTAGGRLRGKLAVLGPVGLRSSLAGGLASGTGEQGGEKLSNHLPGLPGRRRGEALIHSVQGTKQMRVL
ncbi:hypothetical protein EYF80_067622 [Liparis tanakae]|uniref:Uncharacterized protein n=1 Tax=Liparis tanakae TaxID=230148 RepID=A0A4Z2E0I1_9TELE|nr:hypothetical protein EYF80_067622 [Liparis tanakae]